MRREGCTPTTKSSTRTKPLSNQCYRKTDQCYLKTAWRRPTNAIENKTPDTVTRLIAWTRMPFVKIPSRTCRARSLPRSCEARRASAASRWSFGLQAWHQAELSRLANADAGVKWFTSSAWIPKQSIGLIFGLEGFVHASSLARCWCHSFGADIVHTDHLYSLSRSHMHRCCKHPGHRACSSSRPMSLC